MNRFIAASMVLGGLMVVSASAFADDSASSDTSSSARATHKRQTEMQSERSSAHGSMDTGQGDSSGNGSTR